MTDLEQRCSHCGERIGVIVNADPAKNVIICGICDLFPQMILPMNEKARVAHQKKVSDAINVYRKRRGKK